MWQSQQNQDDDRLQDVEESIEEAKQAADQVQDQGLELHHRDRHKAFEPAGDDSEAGQNPSEGSDRDAPGEVPD